MMQNDTNQINLADNSQKNPNNPVEANKTLQKQIEISDKIKQDIEKNPQKYRVLTGDRPTGNLHLGHYLASLRSRVQLSDQGVDTWIVIADYQVITDRDGVGSLKERVLSLLTDYLACGIDPRKATIFTHSSIPELNQLMLPFLSLVTDSELRRNPTVKSELASSERQVLSGLLLTYPVHQAADILFCQANLVPVGQDQLPHIEQTRVVANRFNNLYQVQVFEPPFALLTNSAHILGTDGTKMSKSKKNTIELGMSADETASVIKRAKTDSMRTITYDPLNRPEVSNLLLIASSITDEDPHEIAASIADGGAGKLKNYLTEVVNEHLEPLRKRRQELAQNPDYLYQVLRQGNEKARQKATETLTKVRAAMLMDYYPGL